jgi:hypothetical protein
MGTVKAFVEVAYTLSAVVLPLVLMGLLVWLQIDIRQASREASRSAREAGHPFGAVAAIGVGGFEILVGRFLQIIVLLLLILTLVLATKPYGGSHGWW